MEGAVSMHMHIPDTNNKYYLYESKRKIMVKFILVCKFKDFFYKLCIATSSSYIEVYTFFIY